MFPKGKRVTTTLFKKLFGLQSPITHGDFLYVKYTPHEDVAVSVVIPKKIYKNAVDRNTAKRRIVPLIKESDIKPGIHVFFLKKKIDDVSSQEILKDIQTLISQLY